MSRPKFIATMEFQSTVVTTVDCHKQVRSWRLLRSIARLLIPSCNCAFVQEFDNNKPNFSPKKHKNPNPKPHIPSFRSSSSTFIGTIFGYRNGKISFCIETSKKSSNPKFLIELAVPTKVLAREMRGGKLRIILENCQDGDTKNSTDLWNMCCNGKRVGFAKNRQASKEDFADLSTLSKVGIGAGIVNELMYMRASFRRVCDSKESESFHLIDPSGNIGQELSIFLVRSPV